MKTKQILLAALVALFAFSASAQQVNTLYFLENAPMRHTINPAFQPVSNGYLNFTPLGWMSMEIGNNSLTMSDVLFVDPLTGKTITPLHPNADKQKFLNQFRSMTYANGNMNIGILNFGFRVKEVGYVTIGINERIELGETTPKSIFDFALDGGMKDLMGTNVLALSGLGIGANAYTEISGGYSHKLNDQWTIGGKLKVLLGQAYVGLNNKQLNMYANTEVWKFGGTMRLDVAGPVETEYLSQYVDGKTGKEIYDALTGEGGKEKLDFNKLIDTQNIGKLLTPSGYGAAFDLGFTYKPIEQLQISAAITDLGFIYWNNSSRFECAVDSAVAQFRGVGEIEYSQYKDAQGNFSTQMLRDTIVDNLKNMLNGMTLSKRGNAGFARMTSARLNIGIDANFWDNRVGIGIVSATRLYNARLYEEITVGVAFRPVNWFNIAASYSLMNNGKYSNIGAGIGFMPYDGINLTLAMDYIPTSYAGMPREGNSTLYVLPYKAKTVNLALGFSICWGSNRRDKDKDGVWDKIDMCPETPRGVAVDSIGCPLDEDHDGVPDYLDHCLGTPAAAIGFVDSVGCPLDTDGDGVEDYKDMCPSTPEAARGKVDSVGCPLDTDGDGVPDYLDECPVVAGTKANKGCPEIKREVRQLLQKAMQGIEFETGKLTIKKKSFPLLDQIANIFIENANYVIEVQGHTDNVGKPDMNLKLSQQRADAVMAYLVKKGVEASRMTAVGYGQEVPIADNKTKAGRQKNRRVEFKISFEEVYIETILDHADAPAETPAETEK